MPEPTVLWLSRKELSRLLDMPTAIRAVRSAFKAHARGAAAMPAKVYLQVPDGDFRAMPAFLSPGACGVKWVNVHTNNRRKGLPTVMAMLLLNDVKTGAPLACMDGGLITQLRTAAAGAVAAKALARPRSRTAAILGCGAQAPYQLEALASVFRLTSVRVWGYRKGEAQRFARLQRDRLGLPLIPVASVREAVGGADIIITVTPASQPLVRFAWLSPGTHINAMGADAPGKQELEMAVLRKGEVFVDEFTQAAHGGEINRAFKRGVVSKRSIRAELGEVLVGNRPGRSGPEGITVFDSTGLAIHDIALAGTAYLRAVKLGLGRRLTL